MNCMAGITCSAGMPVRTLMFLYCCSASFSAGGAWADEDCARAPSTSPALRGAAAKARQRFLLKEDRSLLKHARILLNDHRTEIVGLVKGISARSPRKAIGESIKTGAPRAGMFCYTVHSETFVTF